MARRPRHCEAGPGSFHRYKRYTTAKGKPIWRCVDCPSGFNYLYAMIGSKARCHACGTVMPLMKMIRDVEEDTPLEGAPIVCGLPTCEEMTSIKQRQVALEALSEKFAAQIHSSIKVDEQEKSTLFHYDEED